MKNAIEKAIEGGLKEGEKWQFVGANRYWAIWLDGNGTETTININNYLLDPLFWSSLGKAMGWGVATIDGQELRVGRDGYIHVWQCEWHRFIDHLASGGDAESFFNELLTPSNSISV